MNCTIVESCSSFEIALCQEQQCIQYSILQIIFVVLGTLSIIHTLYVWKKELTDKSVYSVSKCQQWNECIWSLMIVLIHVFAFTFLIVGVIISVTMEQVDNRKKYNNQNIIFLTIVCARWLISLPLMVMAKAPTPKPNKICPANNITNKSLTLKQQEEYLHKQIRFV